MISAAWPSQVTRVVVEEVPRVEGWEEKSARMLAMAVT